VVHCSAGIGRTGTVLFCLLCHDHLSQNDKVDIFKVLKQLRSDRGRLVENEVQFKFCLHLIYEMLFGSPNRFPVKDLKLRLQENETAYRDLHRCLNDLPKAFDCSIGKDPTNIQLHRNTDCLPPDEQRIHIQVSIYFNLVMNKLSCIYLLM